MPTYLNALAGRGVHVITVNEYLSSFQSEEMAQLYNFLGLSVGLNLNSKSTEESVKHMHKILLIVLIMNLASIT